MDKDQFDAFVRFAKERLDTPGLYMTSTAAEGRARGYLMPNRPQGERAKFLTRLVDESSYDKSSWDALNLIGQKLIRTGKRLPCELADWTSDVLADQLAERQQQRRPRPAKGSHIKAGRDWNYYHLIQLLCDRWDLQATRNEMSPPRSACDVIATAADEPYKTVERIWSRCSHQMRKG